MHWVHTPAVSSVLTILEIPFKIANSEVQQPTFNTKEILKKPDFHVAVLFTFLPMQRYRADRDSPRCEHVPEKLDERKDEVQYLLCFGLMVVQYDISPRLEEQMVQFSTSVAL